MTKRTKKYWLTHQIIDGKIYRQCSKCKQWLLENRDNFYYMNKNKLEKGYMGTCINCTIKSNRKYQQENEEQFKQYYHDHYIANIDVYHARHLTAYQENKEKMRKQTKEWQENNREKTREYNRQREQKNHKISKNEWKACLEYFNNACAYCGMTLEEHKKKFNQQLHKEHVNHQGNNNLSNCIPACASCNSSKGEYNIETWLKEKEFFSEERLEKIHKWLNEDYKLYIEPPKSKGKYTKRKVEYWENKGGLN